MYIKVINEKDWKTYCLIAKAYRDRIRCNGFKTSRFILVMGKKFFLSVVKSWCRLSRGAVGAALFEVCKIMLGRALSNWIQWKRWPWLWQGGWAISLKIPSNPKHCMIYRKDLGSRLVSCCPLLLQFVFSPLPLPLSPSRHHSCADIIPVFPKLLVGIMLSIWYLAWFLHAKSPFQ